MGGQAPSPPPLPDAPPSPSPASSPASSRKNSDAGSESSSVIYEHEPFATFKDRVLKLALTRIWPGAGAGDITVERMAGGSYNQVIGLTRQLHQGPADASGDGAKEKQQYVLRVPRFENADSGVDYDVSVLDFVSGNTSIPVPRVITFDHGSENVLGSAYCVQERAAGAPLVSVFPTLSHDEKVRVAQDMGRVMQDMLAVRNQSAGRFVLHGSAAGTELEPGEPGEVMLEPFARGAETSTPGPVRLVPNERPAEASPAALLVSMLEAQKAACYAVSQTDTVVPPLLDQMADIALSLERKGWLAAGDDHYYSLAHLDLAPRNILADTCQDQTPTAASALSIVSAILDWDSAVLAPPFVACAPQSWIWGAWDGDADSYYEEDEPDILPLPTSAEAAHLKETFDASAGATYCRFAYSPEYRIARRLFRFAQKRIGSNEDYRSALKLLEEWASICPDNIAMPADESRLTETAAASISKNTT